MSKKILQKLSLVVLLLIFGGVFYLPAIIRADAGEAVDYLQSQPLDDWSAQALVANGQLPSSFTFLDDFSSSTVTDVEKRILTLVSLDQNPSTYYSSRDLIYELTNDYYQDKQIGAKNLLNDDIWGILALAAVGQQVNPVFSNSVDYLVANQNSDGGWAYAVGQDSDTNDTAAALMALAEAGYTPSDGVISSALDYLASQQNSDGAWGYTSGSDSDTASTAWVVTAFTKLGVDISQATLEWLWSQQTTDGSFKWVPSDESGQKYMTAQALIALSDSFFPVKKTDFSSDSGGVNQDPSFSSLRVEGSSGTVCQGDFSSDNALDILTPASVECNFTYEIEDTAYGPYLKKINNDEAQGMQGWMYLVDWQSPSVGAADYSLTGGESVLWYYGEWGWAPLRLSLNNSNFNIGDTLVVEASYFTGEAWQPAADVEVLGLPQVYQTDSDGRIEIVLDVPGTFTIKGEKDNFIATADYVIQVGSGMSQTVGWEVEVISADEDPELPWLAFSVDTDTVDFGRLQRGDTGESVIEVSNKGNLPVYLQAVVTGELSLLDKLRLDGSVWFNFSKLLEVGVKEKINTSLTVPVTFSSSGKHGGEIIFWGVRAD